MIESMSIILTISIMLFLSIFLSKGVNALTANEKKLSDFDKLTTQQQTKELYNQCLQSNSILNIPKVNVHGTEYTTNQNATIFMQVLDSTNQPVNNALCFLTIYYPNKTLFINNVQMMYLLNSDGLYYYDLVVPNALGVYMVSAKCNFYYNLSYSTSSKDAWVNQGSPTTNYGNDTSIVVGTILGNNITSYIQFNNLTMSSISEAYLYLYKAGSIGGGLQVELYRVTSDWNESNITWNNQPTRDGYRWDKKIMNANGWYSWNITDLLKSWANGTYPNYGIYLNHSFPTGGGTWNFTSYYSREYGGDYVPKIVVVHNKTEAITEIRGSGEMHVSNSLSCNLNITNVTTFLNITNVTTVLNVTNTTVNITNVTTVLNITNTTFDTSNITNAINSVDNNMGNNFTNTNSLIVSVNNTILATNSSIFNKLYLIQNDLTNIYNSIISTNSSLTNLINSRFDSLQIDLQTKYDSIISAINNILQQFVSLGNTILNNFVGTGQSLNRIGDTLGISPSQNCGLFDRMAGRC
jgi:hypothetical protein